MKTLLKLGLIASLACVALQAKNIEIQMLNKSDNGTMVFEPLYVKAEVGDTIIFVPTSKSHNTESVSIPDGAQSWKGKINEQVSVTLSKEGVYVYECSPHRMMNMTGIIQVGKPVNLAEAQKAVDTLESKASTNKGRLKKAAANIK